MERVFVTGGSGFVGRNLIAALDERNVPVSALARSDEAAATVQDPGASVIRGDLDSYESMRDGMEECDVVVHAAAKVGVAGDYAAYENVNVYGTQTVLEAAREAGVDRFVHVSTESVLLDGSPLVDVDESAQIPDEPVGPYAQTKARAETLVVDANDDVLTTVIARPRFVWGAGDTTLLPEFVEAVENGPFLWFDGGRYPTSTTHVRNLVEGLILAAEAEDPSQRYHFTDGDPVEFRTFLTQLLETQGVTPPDRSVPTCFATPVARLLDLLWSGLPLPGEPDLTPAFLADFAQPITLDDSLAREELGYVGEASREEGLDELRQES
jgi:nucleoside-diphosphate-sugar epimerase